MSEREPVGPAASRPVRPADEARLLGTWGILLLAGVPEPEALEHLAQEPCPEALQGLARASAAALRAGRGLEAVLDEQGGDLTSWVGVLLAAAPRRGELLCAAADQLLNEVEHGRRREQHWERLALLLRAGAPPGEALGAVARAAREREERALAEALGAAARAARQGGSWTQALSAGGLEPAERLILVRPGPDRLVVLDRLAALAALQRRATASSPAEALHRIAEAAQAGAAPLRRGLERVLSGLEDAFGRSGAKDEGRDLARQTVSGRGERPAEPPAPATPAPAPATPAPSPATPPAPVTGGGKKKTIGGDSGPVPLDPDLPPR